MRLIVTGGTGFIGKTLCEKLAHKGHDVCILTRRSLGPSSSSRISYLHWDPPLEGPWAKVLEGADGVINLAGEPIVGGRWSSARKMKLLESRADSTQAIVHAIQRAGKKPSFLINASAIGFYGPHGDEKLTEESAVGHDFLSKVCKAWEAHAVRAEDFGVRVVRLRIGLVVEQDGGVLAKMLPPFLLGLGGPLGDGKQWMSWIHREDLIGLVFFCLENRVASGALNATAPQPVTMKEFSETLGRILGRPSFFGVPGFLLKILLGEMSDLLLTGQYVLPKRALDLGYRFQFSSLEEALRASLKR